MQYVPAKSFDAAHVRPYFHIALYSNGTKADYRYELQAELQPNPWDRDIRILKDRDGWAEQYQAASGRALLPQPRLTAAELTALDERFWIMLWDTYRLLRRGDADKPFTIYLELLHFSLPPLLHVLPPEDPAPRPAAARPVQPRHQSNGRSPGQLAASVPECPNGRRPAPASRL
jgi:hypothetical protein